MVPYDVEWLNQNHFRAYPLRENATRVSSDGYVLQNEVLLDLVLLSFPTTKLPLYVSQVTVAGDLFEIRISDSDGTIVTSIVVSISLHLDPQSYYVTGLNQYKNIRGHVILGDLAKASQAGVGMHTFGMPATSLLDTCVLPSTPRVSSLAGLGADGSLTEPLLGEVALKEGTNVRIKPVPGENALQIDAIEGINPVCGCEDPFCGFEKPISRINGLGADDSCNLNLRGIGCIKVRTDGNTIVIEDTCTRPGCGDCESFKDILGQLEELEQFCAGNGGGGSTDPDAFDQRPHIYEESKPKPNVCEILNFPAANKKVVSSQTYQNDLSGCGSGISTSVIAAQHQLADSQINANGFYPVRDGDAINLKFKIRNNTLSTPRGFICIIPPANLIADLAMAGLIISGCGTDEITITGNIDFSTPLFQGFAIKSTGSWGLGLLFAAPPTNPYNDPGWTGSIVLDHAMWFILRGFENFPVGVP